MRIRFELSEREIASLEALSKQAAADAAAMIEKGKEGGQVNLGYRIEEGVAVLSEIIKLSAGK